MTQPAQAAYAKDLVHHRPVAGGVMIVADRGLEQEADAMASKLTN